MQTPPREQMGSFISGTPMPTADEKLWGMLAHVLMLAVIGPLLVYLTKAKESSFVRAHAVEALNFQITLVLFNIAVSVLSSVLGAMTAGLGFLLGCLSIPVGIAALVFLIIAAMKANQGLLYSYPVNIRFIK
ncbi:MAG TPA: DUF4870 domain-containing protein [Myxococcus sp.]|jgi:hypothetical protein|nr:DUF4870 domain-containing protein [Myxococcus sp.]